MRWVHTLASVHSHSGATSLPCLARGTPGSFNCSCVSFTLPPSYPPSLHGRYPLHRYYEDSDSCAAPSSTSAGILDSRICTSGHSLSNHPMRPCLRLCFSLRAGLANDSLGSRYRRFFGLRTYMAVSSVASSRIEFVSQAFPNLSVLRTILSFPVALHVPSPKRSYFQFLAFSSTREGLPPSRADSLSSAPLRSSGAIENYGSRVENRSRHPHRSAEPSCLRGASTLPETSKLQCGSQTQCH